LAHAFGPRPARRGRVVIARLQRLSTALVVALALAWAAGLATLGHSWIAALGATAIAFGYALVLGLEFSLLLRHGIDVPALRPSAGQLLRAWAGEAARTPLVFCWRQPFRSRAEPDHLPAQARGRRGLLLVHGFVCNRGLWNPWMRALRARGVPFVAVNLEPPFDSIDAYPPILADAARRLEAATGLAPLVVAHSMGGLAVRAWLARAGEATASHAVVTVATPHAGTWLARYALTRNGFEMRPAGPWLQALAAREPADTAAGYTCFYGHCDNIVFPVSSGTRPGADNRHLAATAHVQMVYHPAVLAAVLAKLER
jgi:pimeloyl-ACP methyl ester carboxylesterase